MNQSQKKKTRNKRFNNIRQITYMFGTEGRRSYSNNWVTRITNWFEDSNWESTQFTVKFSQTN